MAKRFFNATTGKIALVAAGAILVGVAASEVFEKPKPSKRKPLEYNPAPYKWNEGQVRSTIQQLRLSGESDKALIAAEASSRLFGEHPGGKSVSFPPGPNPPSGVNCVWILVVDRVEKMLRTPAVQAQPESFVWEIHHPDDEGYPWDEPSLHPENVPTPGMFFDAGVPTKIGDNIDADHDLEKTVRRALASAMSMAGMNPQLAVGTSNTSKRLRKQMRQLIVGSRFHDSLYGQTDLVKAGGDAFALNEYGRSLNWLPVHADNMELLARNMAPKRTTDTQGNLLMPAGSAMLLWMPAIDLAELSDSMPNVVPYHWPDGSSTQEPPPVVSRLGIDMSGVSFPEVAGF